MTVVGIVVVDSVNFVVVDGSVLVNLVLMVDSGVVYSVDSIVEV